MLAALQPCPLDSYGMEVDYGNFAQKVSVARQALLNDLNCFQAILQGEDKTDIPLEVTKVQMKGRYLNFHRGCLTWGMTRQF